MMKVVCGILLWNDTILIGKRKSDNEYFPDKWELPGGKVDSGETLHNAIIREYKEELDIEVLPFHQLMPLINSKRTIEFTPFVLNLISGKAKLNAHSEIKFVTKAEFLTMDLTDLSKAAGKMLFNSYTLFVT